MQISNAGLYIKLSLEDIQSLLRLGEKIDVKIVEKIDSHNYMVKIKNKTLKAYSGIEFKQGDSATLVVEKMKPTVILKLTEGKPKDFVPTKQIKISIKNIKSNDLHLNSRIDKKIDLSNIIPKIDDNEIKEIASKIKEAALMFRDTAQTLKHDTNTLNNLFIQIPIETDKQKNDNIYIQEEAPNKKTSKNGGLRIVLYTSPKSLGDTKLDMLYTGNKINCTIFCSSKQALDKLNNHKNALEEMLGNNVLLNIDEMKEKITFFKKQIDLKI